MSSLKTWKNHIQNPRRQYAMRVRRIIESSIRSSFESRGYIEVHTPLLVKSPGMECHIRPMAVKNRNGKDVFLHTSPEFAMKKLLAGGMEKIFQLSPCFRDEPMSPTHHPEFTMLEWYQVNTDLNGIMDDVESLFVSIFEALKKSGGLHSEFQDFKTHFPRLKISDLFEEYLGLKLLPTTSQTELETLCKKHGLIGAGEKSTSNTWDDLYFTLWLNLIEPKLPKNQPVFVTDYPPSQSALAVVEKDSNGVPWTQRFEVYAGGFELGNAFKELLDADEYLRRHEKEMALRKNQYGPGFPPNPIDEDFVRSMREGFPPSAGIAMGVDRLVQYFACEPDIENTLWLPSYW